MNKTFSLFFTVSCLIIVLFLSTSAYAAFGGDPEPTQVPDSPEPMLNDTGEYFSGLAYTYPLLPDEFFSALQTRISAVEAQGAGAIANTQDINFISNYAPSLGSYTEEHQLLLSSLTHNFAAETEKVGQAYTDSMTQAFQTMETARTAFVDPTGGFAANQSARSATTRNLILTYTDSGNTDFDPLASANQALLQGAASQLDGALNTLAALNPQDSAVDNQAAVAAARAAVEQAASEYASAVHSSLAYRTDLSETTARGYRSETETDFSNFSSSIENAAASAQPSAMLSNAVLGGLATHTPGQPYYNSSTPLDAVEAFSRTPGARNAAAYDVARRIYDDLETEIAGARRSAGDTAQLIGEGRSQYRQYNELYDTANYEDSVRRVREDFQNDSSQRGLLYGQSISGLAQQYGSGAIISAADLIAQTNAATQNFHLDQNAALGKAQNSFLDHVTAYENLTLAQANQLQNSLATRTSNALQRAPAVRDYASSRMQTYDTETHGGIVNIIDDVVYEALLDLDAKMLSGEVTEFSFASLNLPNLENGQFKHFFFDPEVATGYEFNLVSGPNFRSIALLPIAGDSVFDLYLYEQDSWVFERVLQAGTNAQGDPWIHLLNLDSPDNGVARFLIQGIAREALLAPGNPFAFTAGLSFTDNLVDASITMKPITENYIPGNGHPAGSVIPEPMSPLLVVIGLAYTGLLTKKS